MVPDPGSAIGPAERGSPRYAGLVPVLLLLLIVLVVLVVWRLTAARRPAGRRARPRFVAPDDDPDFLRELDRRAQHDDE